MTNKITQFNWSKNWKKVEKYLNDKDVQFYLNIGMTILNNSYIPGSPPYLEGSIGFNKIIKNKLSWYQPLNRCHHIAPFSFAIGQKLYPKLKWGFLTSQIHTIAVGVSDNKIKIVMDILLFKTYTAQESIDFVKTKEYKLCYTLQEVFCNN